MQLVPAAHLVPLIEADLPPAARTMLDLHLRRLETLTTIRGSYQDKTGRLIVKAFLTASSGCWRGPSARAIKDAMRADLRSGANFMGLVSLLGDHIDGLPPTWIEIPDEHPARNEDAG